MDFEVVCGCVGGEVLGYAAHCGDVEVEGKEKGEGRRVLWRGLVGYGGEFCRRAMSMMIGNAWKLQNNNVFRVGQMNSNIMGRGVRQVRRCYEWLSQPSA